MKVRVICIHNIDKYSCITCRPHLACEHNKLKRKCIICRPHLVCEHKKLKYLCKICKPKKINNCIHCLNIISDSYSIICNICTILYDDEIIALE